MSELFLVRHGQASANETDYDQLSPLGYQQSEALGRHWSQRGVGFDRVYVGALKRHRQTLEAVASAYREAGLRWPEATVLEEFNEYDAFGLMMRVLPLLVQRDPALQAQLEAQPGPPTGAVFWELFKRTTQMWIRGEFEDVDGAPVWQDFKQQVAAGMQKIMDDAGSGEKVAVFTSGGPIAVAFGASLQIDDRQTLGLSWRIYNASITRFLFTKERYSILQFNALPHLGPEQITQR